MSYIYWHDSHITTLHDTAKQRQILLSYTKRNRNFTLRLLNRMSYLADTICGSFSRSFYRVGAPFGFINASLSLPFL